jgi:protein-arginine kinase activator protein McsA
VSIQHPVIIPMLMHFVLERLGQHWTQSDESAVVSKALEKLQITNELLEDLMKTQKKDHETAANTLNQIQQLKKSLKASKKESDGDGKPIP